MGDGAGAGSLAEVLVRRAEEQPDRVAFRFLVDGTGHDARDWTYGELRRRANGVSAALADSVRPGSSVLLALQPGLEFVAALFGILQAGYTAVPAFPPVGRRATTRFTAVLADSGADAVLLPSALRSLAGDVQAQLPTGAPSPTWMTEADLGSGQDEGPGLTGATPAVVQYSSGSTGEPKGIVLTQENLVANCRALHAHMGSEQDRVGLSWLPPYHDMDLMGTIMLAVHGGWPLVMLSPLDFVQSPARWLQAVTDNAVTISVAPNFAFDLCTDEIADDEMATMDLRCLRQVFCGAEPISSRTLGRFSRRFAAVGFDARALIPCYGLAEATLFVSGSPSGRGIHVLDVARPSLERARVVPAGGSGGEAVAVVSCGPVAEGHEVAIVDPDRRLALPPDHVGEIWVRGPNVAAGYLGQPDRSAATFAASIDGRLGEPFLRTGDLGFLHDGELYVTGRIKDLVIVAGRNLYPQDVEASARRGHHLLGHVAAFSVVPEGGGPEGLVVVAEWAGSPNEIPGDVRAVVRAVVASVVADHGVKPADVVVVGRGAIPRTTSGKVRRSACRDRYGRGELVPVGASAPEAACASPVS